MGEMVSESLLLPAMVLAALAWIVPKLMSMILPEGVKPLLLNAFLSAVLLYLLSGAFFFLLYVWQGAPFERLAEDGWRVNIVFFCRLGLSSIIIWAPILVLSVAGLPRTWKKVVW